MTFVMMSRRDCTAVKGFTLTEIALVLGVIGLILGAIWVAASFVYQNQKVAKATQQLLAITQAVRSLYATSPAIGDAAGTDETAAFISAKVFPSDMINGAATVNPWNGTVMVTPQKITNAGDMFGIEYNLVPSSACISLLVATTGAGRDSGLWFASASAAALGAAAYGAAGTAFPISAATAASAPLCTANAATTQRVSVQFAFKLKG
jgi:type II secretory pathway pseudopilin PulG